MMSRVMFASEEVISFEGSPIEPTHVYHPASHMRLRYYENVVYIPHVLPPIMLVEYIPVLYNYLSYEPYLVNRSQVVYVPFIRQISYTYFVPYYYRYAVPEVFESPVQIEEDTSSNTYTESNLVHSICDELLYEDDMSSSFTDSDETSVLSLSSLYSKDSHHDSELISGQEPCDSSQSCECDENIDRFDGEGDADDANIAWEYPQDIFSAVDDYRANESDDLSLSLMFGDDEKNYVKSGLKSSETDKKPSLKPVINERDLRHISHDRCDNRVNFDDRNDTKSDISSVCLFVDDEKPGGLKDLENAKESSLKNVEKERDVKHLSPDRCDNRVNFDDRNDTESDISSICLFVDDEKPGGLKDLENAKESSLKNVEKERDLSPMLPVRYDNRINFDYSNDIESDSSSMSSFIDAEPTESFIGSERIEYSSLNNVEKERDISPLSPDTCVNYINSNDSNDIDSCVSNVSSLDYVTKHHGENNFEHSDLSPFIKENVKRSESYTSMQLSVQSQEKLQQEPEPLHNSDAIVPELIDDVNSESTNDSDGDPAITLQDILASDEYWKVRREKYMQNRRIRDLYRSSLEGDIHPSRPPPQVGTLATIFEDLPFPINEPFDDGLQRVEETEEYFDLPPLEVDKSNSSSTTLLPKKKRFRKTKKFFSGLFRCFRPPP